MPIEKWFALTSGTCFVSVNLRFGKPELQALVKGLGAVTTIFTNNRTQAVRVPAEFRLLETVKKLTKELILPRALPIYYKQLT
jgi:hypothetical protein